MKYVLQVVDTEGDDHVAECNSTGEVQGYVTSFLRELNNAEDTPLMVSFTVSNVVEEV